MIARRHLVVIALAGCGKFQDPNIVVDLRVLAMTAQPPEQVVMVDLANPPQAADVIAQLAPTEVCALVADPNFEGRRLRWSMTVCPSSGDEQCNSGSPQYVAGSGVIDDPDTTVPEPRMCATVNADGNLLGVLLDALDSDTLKGLEGLPYEVELKVGGEDADPALDLYASKLVQVMPDLPAGRTPNRNPTITELDVKLPDADAPMPLALGRCIDQSAPLEVAAGAKLRMTPVEAPDAREMYPVAKLDGTFAVFTESLTYQWVAQAGKFSDGITGGTHDPFGNEPPLFSDWTAPKADDLDGPTDVAIWLVQRDERYGATWYESCIRVMP